MWWVLLFRPENSIWAIVCYLGGFFLSKVLFHVLLSLDVGRVTAFYCAIGVLIASAVLAIVLQLYHLYNNA